MPLPFAYQIRPSQRARKVSIRVSPGKVEVVVPDDVSERRVQQFLLAKQHWVLATLKRLDARAPCVQSLAPAVYGDGVDIPLQGRTYPLVLRPGHRKTLKITFARQFIADVPECLLNCEPSDAIRAALVRWFKKQALHEVEHYVAKHAPTHQLQPRSIKIKTQKSRWGSCGVHNDININWLLMLAPPAVLEYVVVHELCHIKVRNHSAHFWHLVATHLPDYQQHRRWLKEHGGNVLLGL